MLLFSRRCRCALFCARNVAVSARILSICLCRYLAIASEERLAIPILYSVRAVSAFIRAVSALIALLSALRALLEALSASTASSMEAVDMFELPNATYETQVCP